MNLKKITFSFDMKVNIIDVLARYIGSGYDLQEKKPGSVSDPQKHPDPQPCPIPHKLTFIGDQRKFLSLNYLY